MTTATRTVEIVNRQEIAGNIVYLIENDRSERYCVTLRANGTAGCMDSHDERCMGTLQGHTCYHILHCIENEATPYERVEIGEEAIQNMLDNTLSEVTAKRPTRFNREQWRNETFCCNHWWPGDNCHYGNHDLREV